MSSEEQYGIWYTNGEMFFGYLEEEHGNGRSSRWEGSLINAIAQCVLENRHDRELIFRPIPLKQDRVFFEKFVKEMQQEARAKQRKRWA